MQRCVWNALERERYLCACVEAVDSFGKKVPEELHEKAMGELQVALVNMRHWVWDCPKLSALSRVVLHKRQGRSRTYA